MRENIFSSGDIHLRPVSKKDTTAMIRLANNKKIARQVRDLFPYPYAKKDAETFINRCEQENPAYTYSIYWKRDFTGVTGIIPMQDIFRKTAEIGYWVGEPYWNKGIATGALKLISKVAFEHFDFIRLQAFVFSNNLTSMRVLQKAGYQLESVQRNAITKNERLLNAHVYTLLKDLSG